MRTRGGIMGKLVEGGREHHTWCSLWAVWQNEPGAPPVDDLEARCTCGELTVDDLIGWFGSRPRTAA